MQSKEQIKENKNNCITVWNLEYAESRRKAKQIYAKIGSVKCPALKDEEIAFNSIGLNHIIRKGSTPRPKNEQKRRFILLQYVKSIITNPKAVIEFRKYKVEESKERYGKDVNIKSDAYFWTFIDEVEGCIIKVVIRQVGNGKKHFFSVMGNNIKLKKAPKKPKSKS